jgi:hypothetical protein
MTDKQYSNWLRSNVKPAKLVTGTKIKLTRCPENYLKPNDFYYTKVKDGYYRMEYLPTYKLYRSDMDNAIKNGLVLVEYNQNIVIFENKKNNEQLKLL